MSMARRRRSYDPEFKREAVRLVLEEGQKASEVERNLGITTSQDSEINTLLTTKKNAKIGLDGEG
jgi:transposase-like protein